jgi:amino acid transporter
MDRALSAVASPPATHLRRRLGFWLLAAYGTGTIVGAGIYVLVGEVIEDAGQAAPLSFALAGLVAALTGLSYCELASRFPEAAGAAAYAKHGYRSDAAARAVGFAYALAAVVAAATIARGSAVYLQHFVDLPIWAWAAAVIALFTLVASGSVRESVSVAAGITAAEVAGLLVVIAAGAPSFSTLPERWPDLIPANAAGWRGCLAGAFVAFFAYAGFETIVNMAEETRNAARTVPRAIVASIALAGALYTAAVLAVLLTVPPDRLEASTTPLSLVLSEAGWSSGRVVSSLAAIATSNGVLVEILMASRLLYGMAHRGWAPRGLAHVAARTGTPLRATLIVGALAFAFAVIAPIEALAEATSTLLLLLFAAVNLALVLLQRRSRAQAGFRVPHWVPLAGCVTSLLLIPAQIWA